MRGHTHKRRNPALVTQFADGPSVQIPLVRPQPRRETTAASVRQRQSVLMHAEAEEVHAVPRPVDVRPWFQFEMQRVR
jgi:hypothetical protein